MGESLPENFKIIFSYGGRFDHLIDTKKHRHALIFRDKAPAGYVDASDNDLNAIGNNPRIALAFH